MEWLLLLGVLAMMDIKPTQRDVYNYLRYLLKDDILALFVLTQINIETAYLTSKVLKRCKNFGGIKYVGGWQHKFGARPCTRSPEGDYYAAFPTYRQGLEAMVYLLTKIYKVRPTRDINEYLDMVRGWIARGKTYNPYTFRSVLYTTSQKVGVKLV